MSSIARGESQSPSMESEKKKIIFADAVDLMDGTTGPENNEDSVSAFSTAGGPQHENTDADSDVFASASSVLIADADGGNDKCDADFDAFASASSLEVSSTIEETDLANMVEEPISNDKETNLLPVVNEAAEEHQEETGQKRYVTPKDFELLKVIGQGAFGKVLQVRNKQSKKVLAMKVISKRLLKRKSGYIENVHAERNILTKVRHPFVVTMHCSFQTKEKLFIIMDFLAGGELFLRIGREGIFLEKTAAFYLAECILALDHLHTHGVLHRDLKPENILLGSDGHVCLTDFGLAKDFGKGGFQTEDDESKALTVCGTQEYMAPEMVARKGYGRAADWWSLGCIAFEMISGLPPFQSRMGAKDLFRKIMTEKVKMPSGSSAAACKLLKGLLNRNVSARLGASRGTMFEVGGVAALKQAAFFNFIDWEKLERKEVEPPEKLPVEHDEDLRHFHDEFTKMPLPRSVTEMSHEASQPRRCNSDTFRGFSFVQHDFELPERHHEEMATYWTYVEEEGESDSECASSKLDMENDVAQQEQAPEKKKRPPRKRKKKKKAEAQIAPTPQVSGNGHRAISEREDGPSPPEASNTAGNSEREKQQLPAHVAELESSDKQHQGSPSNAVPNSVATSVPPAKEVWQDVKPVSSTYTLRKAVQGIKMDEWKEVKSTPGRNQTRGASSLTGRVQTPRKTPVRGPHIVATPSPDQTYLPAPGSWAAKIRGSDNQAAGRVADRIFASPATNQTSGRETWRDQQSKHGQNNSTRSLDNHATPSGDWRRHSMARGPSSKSLQSPASQKAMVWPSLGDVPPLALNESKPEPAKGAWASRRK